MGKSSKNQGFKRAEDPVEVLPWRCWAAVKIMFPHSMACPGAQSQALPWPEGHIA
jgi:hypothetical protein